MTSQNPAEPFRILSSFPHEYRDWMEHAGHIAADTDDAGTVAALIALGHDPSGPYFRRVRESQRCRAYEHATGLPF